MAVARSVKALTKAFANFAPDASVTDDIIKSYFSALDTPKSLAAWLLYSHKEHEQLLQLDVEPADYTSVDLFHRDYCAISFLSKADFLQTSFDKDAVALLKFQDMEKKCAQTNRRLLSDPELKNSDVGHLLFAMRHKIDRILGSFDIEEFFDNPAWGPGVTTLIKGNDVSAARKFQSEIGITSELHSLISPVLPEVYPLWFGREHLGDSSFIIEGGNVVITVSKNSKTNRVIAIEPGLNLFFQKSIGTMIRRRLRRCGIDLNSQQRNQLLAKLAKKLGLATVDFSSASDTIAYELVRNLLPLRWFTVLDACRSSCGRIKDKSFRWNKFSSMGNGFTFELESLIFYAAALVCCEAVGAPTSNISVFGDDVIIPESAYPSYHKFCGEIGFVVNTEKSHATGFFRESCGSHYFYGSDVKPLFLKERLTDAFGFYKLANGIRRLAHRSCYTYGCDKRLLPAWRSILKRIPSSLRELKIPEGYGDGGLLSNFDEACPPLAKDGMQGFVVPAFTEQAKTMENTSHGLLLARLHSLGIKRVNGSNTTYNYRCTSDQSYRNTVALRNRTRVRLNRRMHVHSWYNLGPWM